MRLPRYSFGNRFAGQPTLPGIGDVFLCPLGGLIESDPVWGFEPLIKSAIEHCGRLGTGHVLIDWEQNTDLTQVNRAASAFIASGLQPWWYTPATIDDSMFAWSLREEDPARYQRWFDRLKSIRLQPGLNVAYDLYQLSEPDQGYWERSFALAAAMNKIYPDNRILPYVWWRLNDREKTHAPVAAAAFRAMVRLAVAMHDRVAFWLEAPDTLTPWETARAGNAGLRVFLDEAGVH